MTAYVFPGQGSQKIGMGKEVFPHFKDHVAIANEILNYSISDLCLSDPHQHLNQTAYTQPALYVVETLTFLYQRAAHPQTITYLAGHSLGEYSALFAAEAFDFATGLQLVKKRGELMGQVTGGGMLAVIGLNSQEILSFLQREQITTVDVANYNAPTQTILSGPKEMLENITTALSTLKARCIPLNVSAAFHSRYMDPAAQQFAEFIKSFKFNPPKIPVIANIDAQPYTTGKIADGLVKQINHSIEWVRSIEYILARGETEFMEIGPGNVLTGLVNKIKSECFTQ